MHSIHYIAVEADDRDEAFTIVREGLLNDEERIAPWSDWYVVGGGRWNTEGYQYEHANNDVISFADQPEQFAQTLEQIKEWRVEHMTWYVKQYNPEVLLTNAQKFIDSNGEQGLEDKFSMDYYYANKISDMLAGNYNSDSHFYDYNNYSASMEYLEPNSRSYLVPVDFHH